MTNINRPTEQAPLASGIEPDINAAETPLPAAVESVKPLAIRYEATLTAPETGDYNLGMTASGFFREQLDGQNVTNAFGAENKTKLGRVHLEAGKPGQLVVQYTPGENGDRAARLVWSKVDLKPQQAAIDAAKSADVVVAVVGITSELEGEEMQVHEEGFKGGDRTSIDLPKPEQELIEALGTTGKPLVIVLTNGSALGVNWAKDHANAILDAFYPGERRGLGGGGDAAGKNNPAGRLSVTFYTGVDQLPPFEDYSMKGRTYRYFEGKPLYPFGYGLSYTTFSYDGLKVPSKPMNAGDPVSADVTVTNTGKLAGDEVVQLYLSFPDVKGAPLRALRGFQRVHLDAGKSQAVHFELKGRDLSMVNEAGEPIIAQGQYKISIGGGQPGSGAPSVAGTFQIKGTVNLPE